MAQTALYISTKRYKKNIKKGGKWKTKYIRKFSQRSNNKNIIYLFFCIWKRIYFVRKHCLEECNLYYYISSTVFLSVTGYLKRSNETSTSIGLVDVVL